MSTTTRTVLPPFELYTFAMSHYSEKIRWTLDFSHLPYQEVCLSPVFHIAPALKMGGRGQTTLPILKTAEASIQDSPRILEWLDAHCGPIAVMPKATKPGWIEAQNRFDLIGKDVARFLYYYSFGVADAHIMKLWTDFATPFQAKIIRWAYPLIRWSFKAKLKINAARVAEAQQRIAAAMDWLDVRLASDRSDYLVGNTFTVADITAASLLAPIACPIQHPIYGDPDYQKAMAEALAPFRQRKSLDWVRMIYARHRGAMKGGAFNSISHAA